MRRLPANRKLSATDQGRVTEITEARRRKMSLHPASGAGRTKGDMSDDSTVIELKTVVSAASHTVSLATVLATLREAERRGKEAVYVIRWEACGVVMEGRIYRS